MKITVLGSGAWEGIPAPFSKNKICKLASRFPNSKNRRTRPGFFIESKKSRIVLEIGPDIRDQSVKFKLPIVNDFLVSHWHFDHMYGLLELGAWAEYAHKKPFNIYCSEKTAEWLDLNFKHIRKTVCIVKAFTPFFIGDIKIIPVPVRHMSYQDKDNFKENNTFGFIFEHNGKRFSYLADYFELPKKTIDYVRRSDIGIIDGTYLFEEEWPKTAETRLLKEDPDHLHGAQIITTATALQFKKRFISVSLHFLTSPTNNFRKNSPGRC